MRSGCVLQCPAWTLEEWGHGVPQGFALMVSGFWGGIQRCLLFWHSSSAAAKGCRPLTALCLSLGGPGCCLLGIAPATPQA